MGWNVSLNCFSAYELNDHYTDCLKSNIAGVILWGNIQCAIFSHGHVPTWIKDSDLLIIYCHWDRCFGWLPTVWLWSTHLCISVCAHTLDEFLSKSVMRGAGSNDDSLINGPHLITLKSGHMGTQEKWLLCSASGRSDVSHTHQITNHSKIPMALHSRERDFNLQCSHQRDFHPPGVSELA